MQKSRGREIAAHVRTFLMTSLVALGAAGAAGCAGDEPEGPTSGDEVLEVGEASQPLADVIADIETLSVSTSLIGDGVSLPDDVAERLDVIRDLVDDADRISQQLLHRDSSREPALDAEAKQLSTRAGQLIPMMRRVKRGLAASGLSAETQREVGAAVERARLAAASLGASVGEYLQAVHPSLVERPLESIESALESVGGVDGVENRNGPLFPGSIIYVLDEGHIDAIDAAYEDDELGLAIHDESVTPDVEREIATTLLVAKAAAKTQVPDARFAFLGPIGSDVWLLPEAQPDAEALGILWPGLATAEIEGGIFVDDQVQIRIRNVIGPNGFSMFFSPPDEVTSPVIVADSEDGLPDGITLDVGTHTHLNWAFEAPGVYLIRVDVRGRLHGVPGNPWVKSKTETLKWVVLP